MMRALTVGMLLALALPGISHAATPAAISLKTPEVLFEQLHEMGFAPEPFDAANTPTAVIHSQDSTLALTLGGCTERKDCSYVVIGASFNDVKAPPADWVAERNANYDLIKVWVNGEGNLAYSAAFIGEGMDRATFRAWIDSTLASRADLAQQVIKAGLDKR